MPGIAFGAGDNSLRTLQSGGILDFKDCVSWCFSFILLRYLLWVKNMKRGAPGWLSP